MDGWLGLIVCARSGGEATFELLVHPTSSSNSTYAYPLALPPLLVTILTCLILPCCKIKSRRINCSQHNFNTRGKNMLILPRVNRNFGKNIFRFSSKRNEKLKYFALLF